MSQLRPFRYVGQIKPTLFSMFVQYALLKRRDANVCSNIFTGKDVSVVVIIFVNIGCCNNLEFLNELVGFGCA